ncbi:Acyl-CoA N-acyltransferases (NAT) superfamily protein [Striga hermonthica]|uniref:Acyl-CoA N-acyltransferases (NAT) superfamily protein n=1 Tax=Striga hermonthica TaxID=68872 RepID=A0A9N7RLH9_STRHE|nr:Acyl-CoA N-acyltransferases (NAT) superfamily protein [Striga hermonthica]
MAAATSAHGRYPLSTARPISPSSVKVAAQINPKSLSPPIAISTNPVHINLNHLRELYAACNLSGHRFPAVDDSGGFEPIDEIKLRTALSHSPFVVSAFTRPEFLTTDSEEVTNFIGLSGGWMRKLARVTPENGRLVGFVRAVSDLGLTAAIYDVMVHPALRGQGIGRMIVKRIVRMLASRGIYDISALCTGSERLFFSACGFGEDILGSTTMMYTRSASSNSNNEQAVSAVGWIDPENKYCTKIDTSGNGNPVWKMKFSAAVDLSDESKFQDLALHVEVHSREPIFLKRSLLGSATIVLKEFLNKFDLKSDVSKPVEEVGSFQLRKKSSNKPLGFVDVSIRVSEEREEPGSSYLGGEGFHLNDHKASNNLASGYGSPHIPPSQLPSSSFHQPEKNHVNPFPQNYQPETSQSNPFPPNHHQRPISGPYYPGPTGPGHYPSRLPPPPSNVSYTPSVFPMNTNYGPSSYISMPSSLGPSGLHGRPGFGMGVGAGALAAGAVIFGDDFMSGFDVPGPSGDVGVSISTYPPF